MFNGWRTFHSLQLSVNRRFRDGVSFGLNDTWVLYDHASCRGARIQHNADGSFSFRDGSGEGRRACSAAVIPNKHIIKGNFVWDLPDLKRSAAGAQGARPGDQRLAVLGRVDRVDRRRATGTGGAYNVGYSYTERRRQREHHRLARLTPAASASSAIPGSGCSSDMYRQFNAAAFQGPLPNSDGLESPAGYLRGCFQSALDLTIARNIRLGGAAQPAAARRHVQRAEPGHRHRAQQRR